MTVAVAGLTVISFATFTIFKIEPILREDRGRFIIHGVGGTKINAISVTRYDAHVSYKTEEGASGAVYGDFRVEKLSNEQ